jgi:hypothetical protein
MIIIDRIEIHKREGEPEEYILFENGHFEAAKLLLKKLSADQRGELFSEYCRSCGSDDPKCQC